jgi:dUTP pyrophosphatase
MNDIINEIKKATEELTNEVQGVVEELKSDRIRGFEVVIDKHRKFPNETINLPTRGSKDSAGYDLYSNETITLQPNESHVFWFDVKSYMRKGEVLKIYPRSSISIKKNLMLKNSVGIIDCVPAGTMIKTKNGEIEVEKLMNENINEIILSYNEDTKNIEDDELIDIWKVNYDELIKIETIEGDIVRIPENKEIFTNRGWVKAKELNLNDEILKF